MIMVLIKYIKKMFQEYLQLYGVESLKQIQCGGMILLINNNYLEKLWIWLINNYLRKLNMHYCTIKNILEDLYKHIKWFVKHFKKENKLIKKVE